jgi:RNA polymerase sigma factor (TIGR02999 family)
MTDVTQLLLAAEQGDPKAADELFPLVYAELRKLAAAKLAMEKPGQTLQATALVHEVYLRLVGNESKTALEQSPGPHWNSRGHFFGAAAEAMRRILVEGARRRSRLKRGGDRERIEMELAEPIVNEPDEEILAVDEALTKFSLEDPEKASLVKLRYFGGLTMNEAALALGISLATAERHWRYARAKLARYVRDGQ